MNYKLSVKPKSLERYKNIDVSDFFKDEKDCYNLEKLDRFTINFEDENELKQFLLIKGKIDEEDMSKPIIINYGEKNVRDIPVIYMKDKAVISRISDFCVEIKKYFNYCKKNSYSDFSHTQIMGDYPNITNWFNSFIVMSQNVPFLRMLQSYVANNPRQDINANDIGVYIKDGVRNPDNRLLRIALYGLFSTLFYKFDDKSKDLVFNYKGFRDFCAFYCDYKRKINEQMKEEAKNQKVSK